MSPLRLVLLAALALGGCDVGPTGSDNVCDGVLSIDIGKGEAAFVGLEDDDDLPFYAGPQGGHHVFVSIRGVDLVPGTGSLAEPDDPAVSVSLIASDEELSTFEGRQRVFADLDDGSFELVGQLVVLSHPEPPELDSDPATLTVTVQDRCGSIATESVRVVLLSES